MEFGDIIWAIVWLITGYYIFKETSLKSFLDGIGIITMLFSLLGIAMEPELLTKFFMKLPISYFGGAVTHYFYFVGANFGRADHFGNDINWGRSIYILPHNHKPRLSKRLSIQIRTLVIYCQGPTLP